MAARRHVRVRRDAGVEAHLPAPAHRTAAADRWSGHAARILALQQRAGNRAVARLISRAPAGAVQRQIYTSMPQMWRAVLPSGYRLANLRQDSALNILYDDAAAQLPRTDFVRKHGQEPQAKHVPGGTPPYQVGWDHPDNLGDMYHDHHFFAGAILHELAHVASAEMYRDNGAATGEQVWLNMNVPAATTERDDLTGLFPDQEDNIVKQSWTILDNWEDLRKEARADLESDALTEAQHYHVQTRIGYAQGSITVHNETVLGDMMYWLIANGLTDTRTYRFARRMLKEANDRRQNGWWSDRGTEARRVDRGASWYQFWKW